MAIHESVQLTTLDNGMRIVSESTNTLETATVGVWVQTGARHEVEENNGISHLLEHMAFKGTSTRTARDIAEQIENVGGHLNAYTSKEQTAYYAKVLRQDLQLAITILADILENPTFDEEELAKEKEVVILALLRLMQGFQIMLIIVIVNLELLIFIVLMVMAQ